MSEERWLRLPCAAHPLTKGWLCGACGDWVTEGWLLVSGARVFRCRRCFDAARGEK